MSRLYILAGVNGAGKSSIGGAMIRAAGSDYYNPDEAARELIAANPGLDQTNANAVAWRQGTRLLQRAIHERLDLALETTLGGSTITGLLSEAAYKGIEVRVWYVGLSSADAHIERVRQRVRSGGHDIPEAVIRRRWRHSRQNLVQLLAVLAELRVYDNSALADPVEGKAPRPLLVLHVDHGEVVGPEDLSATPEWAKPIVAAALQQSA
ncbi:zeta toxin family protein [Mycobacterium sp. IS-3022]|uniref:zeta toxin family protein n=1 Tax=Mycobacterium sp. IS-3022 TaxID=1772277 RepID=UPI002570FA45|nr:zeta toxin family protein [Mycobacterium sp. IS-3022]